MKRNFAMLVAAVSFAALPTFAFAADAIDEIPSAPEAPAYEEPQAGGWSGAYGGVYAGHGWAKHGGVNSKGFNGGVFGGYNMQTDSIVYGGEADAGYSASKGVAGGTAVKHGVNGALRARAGVDMGPAMVYGAAGVAATQGKLGIGAAEDSKTHIGWTAGAGIDAKITGNMIGRIEYRHNAYGKETYNVGGGTTAKLSENEIRIGAGLKF